MVLLAVLCVAQSGAGPYAVPIHTELERRAKRRVARGAVYLTLVRLEKKGLLSSKLPEPIPERGGRARRCYVVTAPALAGLRASQQALVRLWEGLDHVS